jgi:hypothetical protein
VAGLGIGGEMAGWAGPDWAGDGGARGHRPLVEGIAACSSPHPSSSEETLDLGSPDWTMSASPFFPLEGFV